MAKHIVNPCTLSGSGANLTYTPNTNFNGTDSFKVKATDGLPNRNAIDAMTANSIGLPRVAQGWGDPPNSVRRRASRYQPMLTLKKLVPPSTPIYR